MQHAQSTCEGSTASARDGGVQRPSAVENNYERKNVTSNLAQKLRQFLAALATMTLLMGIHNAYAAELLDRNIALDVSADTSLEDALIEWGLKTGVAVMMDTANVSNRVVDGLHGKYPAGQALLLLLKNSGLSYSLDGNRVRIFRNTVQSQSLSMPRNGEGGFSESRLWAVDNAGVARSEVESMSDAESPVTPEGLEQVVVTAEKRAERLTDVPASISAITGANMESLQVQSMSDLAGFVPSLDVVDGGTPGQRSIVLRGLSTGYAPAAGAPLVATYIDDSPVGGTSPASRSSQLGLDLMPYDLDRVEVLRGPQGTLYGADAMGGIIKYVLRKPDLNNVEVRAGADSAYVDNSDGVTWTGRAAANIPIISDFLAMRVSATYRNSPGYIDNVGADAPHSNSSHQSSGRFTLLLQPSSTLSVQTSFIYQESYANDRAGVTVNEASQEPIYGQYSRFSYFTEPFEQQTMFGSIDVNWDMSFATLVSSSNWSKIDSTQYRTDLTPFFGTSIPSVSSGLAYSDVFDTLSKYTEELRLTSSKSDSRLWWMVGGFYTREPSGEDYNLPTFTLDRVLLPYNLYLQGQYGGPTVYVEQAVFANSTFTIVDGLDVGAGIRYSENKQYGCNFSGGVLLGGVTSIACTERPFQSKTTWLGDIRYHLDKDSIVYARVSTGFRPGGGCKGCGSVAFEIPDFYYSDSIVNYELGAKGTFLENRLSLDFSAYNINWSNIQSTVLSPKDASYTGNGGTAVSRGFEFSSTYEPTPSLMWNATLAFNDAHLTENAPGIFGVNGDQLPQSARWMGSLGTEYRFNLSGQRRLFVGGSYRYRDRVLNQFPGTGDPAPMAPQNIFNAYFGITSGKLTAKVYGNNVFNNHSYTGLLLLENAGFPTLVPVQPRTVGLSVDYEF